MAISEAAHRNREELVASAAARPPGSAGLVPQAAESSRPPSHRRAGKMRRSYALTSSSHLSPTGTPLISQWWSQTALHGSPLSSSWNANRPV